MRPVLLTDSRLCENQTQHEKRLQWPYLTPVQNPRFQVPVELKTAKIVYNHGGQGPSKGVSIVEPCLVMLDPACVNTMKPTNPNADTHVKERKQYLFGLICHIFMRFPSFQRTQLWDTLTWHIDLTHSGDTLVGRPYFTQRSCKTLLPDTLTWHSCGTLLLDTLVRHSCKTLLLDTQAGQSYLTLLWDTSTWQFLLDTLVKICFIWHSCLTLLLDTLVGHSYLTLL